MSMFQWIAILIVVIFFVLIFWGFAKATDERVKILGLVASLAGVAVGYLLQEPRVQEKIEDVAEAQQSAARAYNAAATAERQFAQVEQILQSARSIEEDSIALTEADLTRIDSIVSARPNFLLPGQDIQ